MRHVHVLTELTKSSMFKTLVD